MPFVSVEGIDGSGKSEQISQLVERLRGSGKTVIQTKEPDGGHIGREVRGIMTAENRKLSAVEELLLVSASRYDHVRNVIQPAVNAGDWVVSDRFIDSTFAFQVYGGAPELDQLFETVTRSVTGGLMPDVTIILDLPEAMAAGRRHGRADLQSDPSEVVRNFSSIREGLLEVANRFPERCCVIDASRSLAKVADDVWQAIAPLL
ncbi:dTMP kinase [Mesorhizobium sp. CO1-1-11]|uniref:dTMP kinase n=1 Tax=Mesorhizobium sp. CO1-1-11 TaxID=2876636 RepID=UPI001CC9CB12|nr:dTMP kinase [Mesorhizobium sp. CO1-1-11]MBZ9727948.1 dTMP kinase [Mesorhizobium sp. CO1-1-11]